MLGRVFEEEAVGVNELVGGGSKRLPAVGVRGEALGDEVGEVQPGFSGARFFGRFWSTLYGLNLCRWFGI